MLFSGPLCSGRGELGWGTTGARVLKAALHTVGKVAPTFRAHSLLLLPCDASWGRNSATRTRSDTRCRANACGHRAGPQENTATWREIRGSQEKGCSCQAGGLGGRPLCVPHLLMSLLSLKSTGNTCSLVSQARPPMNRDLSLTFLYINFFLTFSYE